MSEESEMTQENQVEEPQTMETPEEQTVEPEPVAPQAPTEYTVNVEGRSETVSADEYKYLADMGANALLAAQYSAQQSQSAQAEPAQQSYDPEEDLSPYNSDTENALQSMGQRLQSLEQNLYKHKVDIQTEKIRDNVEDLIDKSPVFKAMKALPNNENIEAEIRREVYNKQLQEKMDVNSAVSSVETKYSAVLGGDRKNWLLNKIKNIRSAGEAGGGGSPSPQKPLTADDWNSGKLLQSITAKLNAADL